eukprot:m.108000 g.108000  ORF g.108000 m.108000 type:complete len:241 (+) comp15876_c2_seq2:189-911(+)
MAMNQYRKLGVLGRGAFGTVLKVERKSDAAVLVVKTVGLEGLSSKELSETLNEAKVMSRISHPNIISYMDSFVESCHLHIVMEYAGSGDLAQRIVAQRGHYFEEDFVWMTLIQIARGLLYLHERRVLHRDLKPSNCFLCVDGSVKIGDLGFGRVLRAGEQWAMSGVGTPLYYSPELCKEQPYNERSDIRQRVDGHMPQKQTKTIKNTANQHKKNNTKTNTQTQHKKHNDCCQSSPRVCSL